MKKWMNYYCWFEVVGFDDTSDFQVKDENSGLNDSSHWNGHFQETHRNLMNNWHLKLGLLTHS